MKMLLNRRYFIASFLLHILLLAALNFFCVEKRIHKKIVVYGAHSKNIGTAIYKPRRTAIPFSDPRGSKKGGNRNKRSRIAKSKNTRQKAIAKKQPRIAKRQTKKQPAIKKTATVAKPKATSGTAKKQSSQKKLLPQPRIIKKKALPEPKKKPAKQLPPKLPEKDKNPLEPVEKEPLVEQEPPQETPAPTQPETLPTTTTPEPAATPEEIAPVEDVVLTTTAQDMQEIDAGDSLTTEEQGTINLITEASEEWNALQEYISKEIARVWHPSVGIPRDTEAEVDFTIDGNGNLVAHPFKKKSNVIIYDRSIVIAISEMKFSPLCYNKQFSVKFRQ